MSGFGSVVLREKKSFNAGLRETGCTDNHEKKKKKNAEQTNKRRSYRSCKMNYGNDGFVLADLRLRNSCMGIGASTVVPLSSAIKLLLMKPNESARGGCGEGRDDGAPPPYRMVLIPGMVLHTTRGKASHNRSKVFACYLSTPCRTHDDDIHKLTNSHTMTRRLTSKADKQR